MALQQTLAHLHPDQAARLVTDLGSDGVLVTDCAPLPPLAPKLPALQIIALHILPRQRNKIQISRMSSVLYLKWTGTAAAAETDRLIAVEVEAGDGGVETDRHQAVLDGDGASE